MNLNDPVEMVICDTCGCVVEGTLTQLHVDWHDSLMIHEPLSEEQYPVANPERARLQER
jgi:hypothetical protein